MQFKNYIALLFVVIFLGKMVTMDAKFFGVFLDVSGVTLVNKMCSKEPLVNIASEDLSTAIVNHDLEMDFLCHSVFDHQLADWKVVLTEDNFRKYNYQVPGFLSTPREKFYPPPKAWTPSV